MRLALPIYILHENDEWLIPLRKALSVRGVTANEWFIDEGKVPYDQAPPEGIFYNRMSASSHDRGHRFAPELTRMTLIWLQSYGRRVINGPEALSLEVNKLLQYSALNRMGIGTPRTQAIVGKKNLLKAAEEFSPSRAFIIKPNRGGKGRNVRKFTSVAALETYLFSDEYEEPIDGIWLLQEHVESQTQNIHRLEFVAGKFLYAVKVNTSRGYALCPVDGDRDQAVAHMLNSELDDTFEISNEFEGQAIIGQLESFLEKNGIDIAAVEIIQGEDGWPLAFDLNTNTNYNEKAEKQANVKATGMQAIADYLIELAR